VRASFEPEPQSTEKEFDEMNDTTLKQIEEFLLVEEELEDAEEKEKRLIEERRKRREEIMKKHEKVNHGRSRPCPYTR
jgi:hypothetical protein